MHKKAIGGRNYTELGGRNYTELGVVCSYRASVHTVKCHLGVLVLYLKHHSYLQYKVW